MSNIKSDVKLTILSSEHTNAYFSPAKVEQIRNLGKADATDPYMLTLLPIGLMLVRGRMRSIL